MSEEMYRIQKDPIAANYLIVKNSEGYEWWFNYRFEYGNKSLDEIFQELPSALVQSTRQLFIYVLQYPDQGFLPCIYIGDKSATEQNILKTKPVAEGTYTEIWPIFEAYARML